MAIELFNTLSGKKEAFEPLEKGVLKMYNCGPTVYNYAHIGNLRSYVLADTIRRTFEYVGYEINQIINITDVGHLTGDTDLSDLGKDKVEEEAKKENKTAREVSDFYTQAFFEDLDRLNIERSEINFPRATDHIPEQISLIEKLEKKGHIYKTSDGIYFDTSTFKGYGKLGNINLLGLEEGARIGVNSEKKHPTDFALWKFSPTGEKRQQEWGSPWGTGFPGWHIECSAMSMKYLGETFDIHTGGIDHIPVHHNNEIAQSESATGKKYANYWIHNAFITIATGEKMAKSEGNFIRLQTLIDKDFHPLAYRYLLLTAHYRSPMTFSFEALQGSQNAYEKLLEHIRSYTDDGKINETYQKEFLAHIENDFDTPQAIATMWKLIKDQSVVDADKKATILDFDRVLGLGLSFFGTAEEIPETVNQLVVDREQARLLKDWKRADEIRLEIEKLGYGVKDSETGPIVLKVSY